MKTFETTEDYRVNHNNYSKNVENGNTIFMKRTYNPHSNKISYNGERFDKLNNQVTKKQGEIDVNPFDDDRKVAFQMAQGNGNYVKSQGWK